MLREYKNAANVTNCVVSSLDLYNERRPLIFIQRENQEFSPSSQQGGSTPRTKAEVAQEMRAENGL